MGSELQRWYVYIMAPRDNFYDYTMPIGVWLWHLSSGHSQSGEWEVRHAESAYRAYQSCSYEKPEDQRSFSDGRVLYDPVSDDHYFLFKESNNGTTYLVRHGKMEYMTKNQ